MANKGQQKRLKAKRDREVVDRASRLRTGKLHRKHNQVYFKTERYRVTGDSSYLNANVKDWLARRYPRENPEWEKANWEPPSSQQVNRDVKVFPEWDFTPQILPRHGVDRLEGQRLWERLTGGALRLGPHEYVAPYTDYEASQSREAIAARTGKLSARERLRRLTEQDPQGP